MPKPVFISKKPAKKPGRPTLLNPTRQAALLKAIELGMPLKQAAAMADMSYDTLSHWQKRGENESAPPEYRQFCQQLRLSQAVAMQVNLSVIHHAAGRGDWRASAWMLDAATRKTSPDSSKSNTVGRVESLWHPLPIRNTRCCEG